MRNERTMAKSSTNKSRETRTSKRRGLTRAAIVNATAAAIQKDGEEDFSLDEVAAELGLTKPALYYYFKTREVLLLDVFVAEMENVAKRVDEAVEKTKSASEAIEVFVRTLSDYHDANTEMFRFLQRRPALMNAEDPEGTPSIERMLPINDLLLRATVTRIMQAVQDGSSTVEAPRRLAFLLFTTATGVLAVRDVIDAADHEAMVDDLIEMFQARLTA